MLMFANRRHQEQPDYIDSWLLTGFCAQQAILAIDFSKIVHNISQDETTADDQTAIRLWSVICLQHLRLAQPPHTLELHLN